MLWAADPQVHLQPPVETSLRPEVTVAIRQEAAMTTLLRVALAAPTTILGIRIIMEEDKLACRLLPTHGETTITIITAITMVSRAPINGVLSLHLPSSNTKINGSSPRALQLTTTGIAGITRMETITMEAILGRTRSNSRIHGSRCLRLRISGNSRCQHHPQLLQSLPLRLHRALGAIHLLPLLFFQ